MNDVKISILILSFLQRQSLLTRLLNILSPQVNSKSNVEVLILTDNQLSSIGEKRNKLLEMAKGEYICYLDDDDTITTDFIRETLLATRHNSDVITFKEKMGDMMFDYGLKYENSYKKDKIIYRIPNHRCLIKKEVIGDIRFPHINRGEDDKFSEEVFPKLKSEHHIDKVLYFYNYDTNISTFKFN